MARTVDGEALRHVHTLFEAGAIGGLTDRQLLERFRARDGAAAERAFAVLVERHGPMVLRVCRRTLRDEHEAQDAFQATFLVLVRKAGSLTTHESLGGWLHAVACRVAACARTARARRRAHERSATEAAVAPAPKDAWDDLGTVLHEEIRRLPAAYRAAVVLCALEGLTQEQAAQRLGCPPGTVRSRLARGRARLQARLKRRGVAPAAGGLAGLLAAETATAAVPAELLAATIRAATLTAAGQSIAGAGVAALTEGVLRALFMTRLRMILAAVLVTGAGVGGAVGVAFQQATGRRGEAAVEVKADEKPRAPESGSPGTEDSGRRSETSAEDGPADGDKELNRLRRELERARERLTWSNRMLMQGYISVSQHHEDRQWLEQAQAALKRRQAELEERGKLPGEQPPAEERKRDETGLMADLSRPWDRRSFANEAELAGLPPDSQPATLDWERVYALALIHSRAGRAASVRDRAESLDPNALAQQAKRYDVADFARFRKEFLAGRVGASGENEAFHDPASTLLALHQRRQEFENARAKTAALENLMKVLRHLIQKVSSGLSQLHLDEADASLQQARLHLVDVRERYRNQLDALKVQLGLSPHAPVVLDGRDLPGFRKTFQDADLWCADPRRDMRDLVKIIGQLPTLQDLVIDGHSAAAVAGTSGEARESEAEFLTAVAQAALKNKDHGPQAIDTAELELRVRAMSRRLLHIRVAYEIERRRFVYVVRGKDQAHERLVAPPRRDESPEHRAELFAELLKIEGQVFENQDRLVALWTEYQTLRLALFREVGTLPCDDWKSFYDQLRATPGGK